MKAIMITVRLWWFYLTYKGIKTAEIRKRFAKDFKGKIFECVSKTNWKKDLMKIPEEEREFFKQFVGKVGLCFECDKVEEINRYCAGRGISYKTETLNDIELCDKSCLDLIEIDNYLYFKKGYAIHVTNLEIFDKPKEITEFEQQYDYFVKNKTCNNCPCVNCNSCIVTKPVTRAPTTYCYIEVDA